MTICPDDEAGLAEAIRQANGPLRIMGGGTRMPAPPGPPGTILSTAGLAGIVTHEPGALTLVARAGTPLAEIEALLAAEGQRLAFEPPDLRGLTGRSGVSTIGGVVAANASGPRRVAAGACRDSLLGIRAVDGSGMVFRNGGRVMKNVTGYDLARLMAGSRGMLGVLTEVALKVLPVPEVSATVVLEGLEDSAAVAAMTRAMATPYEVTGAAHLPGTGTFLRIEGMAEQVRYRARGLVSVLGGTILEEEERRWQEIRDVAAFRDQPGDVWRLSLRPSDAPGIVARAGPEAAVYDWAGGLVWLRMAQGSDLRDRLGLFKGHATLIRAAGAILARLPVLHPEPAPIARLTAGLRARFDPRGLFAA